MKAVTCRRYGSPDVLKIEELEIPVPKANEVLVKVRATTVTSGDAKLRGFAVQLAKEMGAHVTAVCSTRNIELVQSLGADRVIDYTVTDFTKDSSAYDVILDTVGNTSFFECRRVMTKHGRHVFLVHQLPQILQALGTALVRGKRVICGISMSESRSDLMEIKELVEAGRIRPVVDITYPLQKIIEAHQYVETGRKRGAVVVSVNASSEAW